jgi:hypothetical protein
VKQISEWADRTVEGNGIWKSECVARHFKTAKYTYRLVNTCVGEVRLSSEQMKMESVLKFSL